MDKTGCGVIDMPFLSSVNEGGVRCYMLRDRCRGILHQLPLSASDDTLDNKSPSYPNLNVCKSKRYRTYGLPNGKFVHPPNSPDYQELVKTLENDWIPKLVQAVGLLSTDKPSVRDALPVVWDIDFICRSTESLDALEPKMNETERPRYDKYVLCEVNCSCVFPAELMKEMASEIVNWTDEW